MTETIQPGPCVVCGLRNYRLSMGGPTICPTCDTGYNGPALIKAQRDRIAELERCFSEAESKVKAWEADYKVAYERGYKDRAWAQKVDAEYAQEVTEALRELHDEQNDAPLERRRHQWEAAMEKARAALAKNPNGGKTVTPEEGQVAPEASTGSTPTNTPLSQVTSQEGE